ncbi:hypothetical protein H650_00665 [Enterobacter sp. R4-368]|nr:hypothetical protein H650_00665 [Enterobacter sp. R4-368]
MFLNNVGYGALEWGLGIDTYRLLKARRVLLIIFFAGDWEIVDQNQRAWASNTVLLIINHLHLIGIIIKFNNIITNKSWVCFAAYVISFHVRNYHNLFLYVN